MIKAQFTLYSHYSLVKYYMVWIWMNVASKMLGLSHSKSKLTKTIDNNVRKWFQGLLAENRINLGIDLKFIERKVQFRLALYRLNMSSQSSLCSLAFTHSHGKFLVPLWTSAQLLSFAEGGLFVCWRTLGYRKGETTDKGDAFYKWTRKCQEKFRRKLISLHSFTSKRNGKVQRIQHMQPITSYVN